MDRCSPNVRIFIFNVSGQLGLSLGVGLRADIVDLEYFGLEEMAEA